MRLRSATSRPMPRSSSSRSTRDMSGFTVRVYGGAKGCRHSLRSGEPSQENPMNEPYPGAPDNYSGQPTSEPPQQPAQPSGPPDATYEPTRQYPAQPYAAGQSAPQYGTPSYGASDTYGQPTPGYAQSDAGSGRPGPSDPPPDQASY